MYGVCRFPLRDIVKWIIYQAIPNPDSLQIALINITGVIFIFLPGECGWGKLYSMSITHFSKGSEGCLLTLYALRTYESSANVLIFKFRDR